MNLKFYLIFLVIIVVVGVTIGLIQSIVEDTVQVKSSRAVDNYDFIKYFKEDRSRIQKVEQFLLEKQKDEFRVKISYTSPSGRSTTYRVMPIHLADVKYVQANPTVVMRSEEKRAYNQVKKDRERAAREELKKREQANKSKLKAQNDAESAELREKILLERAKAKGQREAELAVTREEILLERDRIKQAERQRIAAENATLKEKLLLEQAKAKGQREAELAVIREKTRLEREKARNEREKIRQDAKREKEIQLAEQHSMLARKRHDYINRVDEVIEYANCHKENLIIQSDIFAIDRLVAELYDRAYKVIKVAKSADSGEWDLFDVFLSSNFSEIKRIAEKNLLILAYYNSPDFAQIKDTCNALMGSQREFNNYIEEKANSLAAMFGSAVVRNETENIYKNNYFRPYKKTITPFTAEVSKAVFASAENDSIEYIIKKFYPNKHSYPEQIQKLQLLIGELETLKDARVIIDNYKKDYQQYLSSVPDYVMENDKDGFYARLGFADVSESALTIEYRFNYTSDGGMIQRTFPIPMTEETITKLIDRLESKLTIEAFSKEQRSLMTPKLRNHIIERDNYTCQVCGNSTYQEPNLLLEIDHIIPISKGGVTIESNLQTLCWKCNRAKSNKVT